MTCTERERDLALCVGGDLQDAALERHVQSCPRCREYVASMRALLADMAADAAPAAPEISTAVMRRIRMRRYGWAALGATAAAVSLIVATFVNTVMQPVATIAMEPRAPAAVLVTHDAVRTAPKVHRARHHRPKPVARTEPVVVKLITADPNVVIYWITD
jgi:predicted anti-sigma-YlaC factor YlaD